MPAQEKSDLFSFMLDRVKDTQKATLDGEPQAFGRWFAKLFFRNPQDFFISDGARDGQIDHFFTTHNGKAVSHHVVNTKYTTEFNRIAPPQFYQEITYFWRAFENRSARAPYLAKSVKPELRPRYKQLFDRYDEGAVELMFVTNHRRNEGHYEQVKNIPGLRVFHLDDLIQYLVDDIDNAMPLTQPIGLNGINALLPADRLDTEVATSIVFARLVDFIRYMDDDPFDLLFNRNVRVPKKGSSSTVNNSIRETFKLNPKEFAFSNNGITMLCDKQHYNPGQKVLTLDNPRVVNGSQTLHSIRDVPNPSANARVMVRIIEIEPPQGDDLARKIKRRKDVVGKIAVRSNRQNPIKSWDLASNDEFQLDLFSFFRQKGFFYERRVGEWSQRSRELKSIGMEYGSNIRRNAQLISSFHGLKPRLGPAIARSNVASLLEGDAYDKIRATSAELVFQIFLLDESLNETRRDLAREKAYIQKLKTFDYFALFSLAVRALSDVGAQWGDPRLTGQLYGQWKDYYPQHYKQWHRFAKECIDHILVAFKKEAAIHKKKKGEILTYANYFKNQSSMERMLRPQMTPSLRRLARAALNS